MEPTLSFPQTPHFFQNPSEQQNNYQLLTLASNNQNHYTNNGDQVSNCNNSYSYGFYDGADMASARYFVEGNQEVVASQHHYHHPFGDFSDTYRLPPQLQQQRSFCVEASQTALTTLPQLQNQFEPLYQPHLNHRQENQPPQPLQLQPQQLLPPPPPHFLSMPHKQPKHPLTLNTQPATKDASFDLLYSIKEKSLSSPGSFNVLAFD